MEEQKEQSSGRSTNEQRKDRAYRTLLVYMQYRGEQYKLSDREAHLTDLLTDLMHEYGQEDFDEALRIARDHFSEEQQG